MKTISNEQCAMCNDQQPRKMKDSGIEWIGEIPEGWNLLRMKWCISKRDSGSWGTEPTGENDTICLRIADFDYARFAFQNKDVENLTKRHYSVDVVNELTLQKNDILIEKSGGGEKTPVGRTVIFDKDYVALFANFMDRLRCSDNILPKYMQYVFVTFYKNEYTRNYIKQTTGIQNLDLTSMLSQESVPLPPLHKQQAIAAHLDRICSEIDSVIEKTKATIEEYKALKQSVITQAVTKGIRKGRKMKDSGIEWIGEIPEEWEIRKLFRAIEQIGDIDHYMPESVDKGVPYLMTGDLSENISDIELNNCKQISDNDYKTLSEKITISKGDVIFARYATIGTVCYVDVDTPFLVSYSCLTIKPMKKCLNGKYLFYYLKSDTFFEDIKQYIKSNTQSNVGLDSMGKAKIILPSLNEQQEIANHLDEKCAAIDTLIAKKEQLLTELESYKKSVIYEYVTGKKEVE